jgi:hypothetical protein
MRDAMESIAGAIEVMALLLLITVPLGVWKAVELVYWVCTHVYVSAGVK